MRYQLFITALLTGLWLSGTALSQPAVSSTEPSSDIAVSADQAKTLGITTVPLSSVTQSAGSGFPAKVVIPNSQLRVIGAPLEGVVDAVHVAAGEPVEKGQVLAEMKSPALIDEQRDYLTSLSALQVARSAMNRDDELLKEGIIAKSRHQVTQSAFAQAEADFQEKRQSLGIFGMSNADIKALEKSRKISNSLKITSPLTGFVLEQTALAGQRVEAASPLYKVGSLTPMWVEINMPAAQAARVQQGDTVTVANPAASGKVISVGKSLDAANQTIMVRAEIDENAEQLHPEQQVVAAVKLDGGNTKQWQLPAAAVIRQDGKAYVFIKTASGFRAQSVTVQNANATHTTISGALNDTDQVVSTGVLAVKGKWQGLGGGE